MLIQQLIEMAPPAKKQKVEQRYRPEYTATWPSIIKSKLSECHVRCTVCDSDFTVKSGGANDIERHLKSKKHVETEKVKSTMGSMTSFFSSSNSSEQAVTNAEMLFNKFIVEHNLPMSAFDHAGDLFRQMFPDSNIAKKFSCGRSKAGAITKYLAGEMSQATLERMAKGPFSLATDGSNDGGAGQLYPIVVRTFDEEKGKVMTDLVEIKTSEGASTGENIFNILDRCLEDNKVSWEKCLAFSCDNASVMTGIHKGVSAFIHGKNPEVYINGCPCHLLHLVARTATKELSKDIEELLVDIFFYLDKSSKRKKSLQAFQRKCGTELHAIIKHGPTRWLSLHSCVDRLLEQWEPLKEYFKEEKDNISSRDQDSSKQARLMRINRFFDCPSSKLYALFLQENLPIFTTPNLQLQTESPQIHRLMARLDDLLTDIVVRFVKPEAVAAASNLFKIKFDDKNVQHRRKDLIIGDKTRKLFQQLVQDPAFTTKQEDDFVKDVKNFFSSAAKYIVNKFPLTDKLLQNAAVLDVSRRLQSKYDMLEFFIDKFPSLLPSDKIQNLRLEFSKFQTELLPEEILEEERVDIQWHKIGQLKTLDNIPKFAHLAQVMKGLCCLSHSNADTERVFSLVRKNHTEFRARMTTESLSALIIQKVHMNSRGLVCHQHKFSASQLAKAKRAYCASLNQ